MKRGLWASAVCLAALGCTPYPNVSVTPGEKYWGATFPDGSGAITAVTDTLTVERSGFSSLSADDFGLALAAARAYCADQGLVLQGDGRDENAGLPSFFEGGWELAAGCRESA